MAEDLANAITNAAGQAATVRVGTVTAVNPLQISLGGTALNMEAVGVVPSAATYGVGMPVALLGQSVKGGDTSGASWLALGPIAEQSAGAPQSTNGVHINPGSQFETNNVWKPISGSSFAFTKQFSTTRIFAQISGSGFADTISDALELGLRIGATDYSLALHFFNIANCHFGLSGFDFLTGIPAGAYGIQPVFRIASGAGTVRFDSNDRISAACTEVI